MSADADVASRLAAARERIGASSAAVLAAEPWPLAARFDHTPETTWGPPEVLAHLVEMVPFWHRQLRGVAAGNPDGSPVAFGRVATDPDRAAEIERLRTFPLVELYRRLDETLDALAADMGAWSAAEWARSGLHPVRGEVTVRAGLDRFIVDHLGDHADQLAAIVAEG